MDKESKKIISKLKLNQEVEMNRSQWLEKYIDRIGGELDSISAKIKATDVVTGISGAVSFLSTLLLVSSDDFNVMVAKNGENIFASPAGHTLMAIGAIGLGVAGLGYYIHNRLENKFDQKYDKYEERCEQYNQSQTAISEYQQAIEEEIAAQNYKEEFAKNMEIISRDFEGPDKSTSTTPDSEEDEFDLITDYFKNAKASSQVSDTTPSAPAGPDLLQ